MKCQGKEIRIFSHDKYGNGWGRPKIYMTEIDHHITINSFKFDVESIAISAFSTAFSKKEGRR